MGSGVVQDALYGAFVLDEQLRDLSRTPVVQRLRHVRLSNIDSIDMPGIANLSRYEHVLGVAYLAGQVGPYARLPYAARTAFGAAALLHDWAITAYGHLVEEAFQYAGTRFDHERRLLEIVSNETPEEVGGVQRQVLMGRETQLIPWADRAAGSPQGARELLDDITLQIAGQGTMGRLIASDIDLDNIDNVFRLAHHMGLPIERTVPVELARAVVAVDPDNRAPVFRRSAKKQICHWQATRRAVYERLMLAPHDFAGKMMMLYGTIWAVEAGQISKADWNLTDSQLVDRLQRSDKRDVREAVQRWIAGELWELAPLHWMEGSRPEYVHVREFCQTLSETMDRACFAYAISDKRVRRLIVRFDDGVTEEVGGNPRMWLLGIGSPVRRRFTAAEARRAFDVAASYFAMRCIGTAEVGDEAVVGEEVPAQHWLF